MCAQVWGTFAVNDHCRANAFAREALLFDRLVVPVPASEQERARWRKPNEKDPDETWNPERQDALLAILGSQHRAGHNGARIVYEAPWHEYQRRYEQSRLDVVNTINEIDAFSTTRLVLATGEALPKTIEAVAAFPSVTKWREEVNPRTARTGLDAALVLLTRPLLVPDGDEDPQLDSLREVVDLALDNEHKRARAAYNDWLRAFFRKLHPEDAPLAKTEIDQQSLELAGEELDALVADERRIIQRDGRAKRWTRVEYATTAIGVGVGIAVASGPLAVGAALFGFAGWIASKQAAANDRPKHSPLTGASMFVAAQSKLGWEN
jgi:hypothetical protein